MWKRVKGLWKVLKPNEKIPSPRIDLENKASSMWKYDDYVEDGAKMESDDNT